MTRRSFRFALAGVPALLAVGMAAACGPYGPPGCTALPAPAPQAPACATVQVAPPAVPVWTLSVLDGKLQLQTAEVNPAPWTDTTGAPPARP